MVGLSDIGLYQRTLLIFNGTWTNTRQGEKGQGREPPKAEPLISVAVDLPQKLWICRGNNWKIARASFLGAVSGTAETQEASIVLKTPRGDVIVNQYFKDDHPRAHGPAYRGMDPTGATQRFAQRTHWWRYDDPSVMTPFDRMAEMLDRAVRSPKLKAALREQFGGIISPEVLLPLAGTFFCLFGAEFVGGAAAALTIARLLQVNQFLCDAYFYEPRAKELHRICMGAAVPRDLDQGADLLVEILVQILADLATTLGISALTKLASQLFTTLAMAVPESVRLKLKDNAHVAAAYIRGKGYAKRELLKDASGTPLEAAAVTMYKRTSEQNREILVVREPDAQRAAFVNSTMQQNAKPPWLKARSPDGFHGLVCLKKSDMTGELKSAGTFEVAQIRGFSEALDAEHLPARLPMYEMPTDGRNMGSGMDYHYTGAGNVELRGHKLVDLGDRLLVVDAMGRPYVSDLDLATRHRPGLSNPGAHLPQRKVNGVASEDHPVLEYRMNQEYIQAGGNPTHLPNQHGGGGATMLYIMNNLAGGKIPGKDFWSPRLPDGSYKLERLIIFIPEWINGRIQSRMYAFASWGDFKTFCDANNMKCPIDDAGDASRAQAGARH